MKALLSPAFTLGAIALAGCTVHQTATPGLTGPSGLARSVTVTATPDRITQDGASFSTVVAFVIGSDGRPQSNVGLRMDMLVDGQLVDYGTISPSRTVTTGTDGKAQ